MHKEALSAGKANAELKILKQQLKTEELIRLGMENSTPIIKQLIEENKDYYERNIKLVQEKNQLEMRLIRVEKEFSEKLRP